jgi:hypothetical protein
MADWQKMDVAADQRSVSLELPDEETPYVVRVQAATDGVGIISETYEVTTGKKRLHIIFA